MTKHSTAHYAYMYSFVLLQEKIKEKIHWSIREEKFLELDSEISHRHFSVSIRGSEFTFGKTPAKMLSHKTDCSFIDL